PAPPPGARDARDGADQETLQLAVGDRVAHATLGEGVVVATEGAGPRLVAKVRFASSEKRLLVRMAPLTRL
ncbi:hypothetical protein ACFQ23_13690, partial [Schaalia naturae]